MQPQQSLHLQAAQQNAGFALRHISLVLALVAVPGFYVGDAVSAPQGTVAPADTQSPATKSVASIKSEAKPAWKDLSPEQQLALKPLASDWRGINEAQKRKWLAVSKNYPSLALAEQQKLHSRMTEWVALSQQQRNQARLNFAETKAVSPSDKVANWAAYQALPQEEKQKLAAAASQPPVGAAIAVKPVNPQKMAPVPVTRHIKKANPDLVTSSQAVDQNTLLPKIIEANDPASVQKN